MTPLRVALFCCALTLALAGSARAGEVEATLACHHRSATCAKPCYDPCEQTGPVRRFFRRVFLPPCPRPCPAPTAVVVVPPPAPRQWVPPAELGRPTAPAPTPVPTPDANDSPFPAATTTRQQRLTPATPPPPVRLDHLASRNGGR